MKITRLDDGLAVKLPEDLVAALGLKAGDEVDVEVRRVETQLSEPSRAEILESIRAMRRPLPDDYRFDREELNQRR